MRQQMYLVSLGTATAETTHYLLTKAQWDRLKSDSMRRTCDVIEELFRKHKVVIFDSTMELIAYAKLNHVEIVGELQDVDYRDHLTEALLEPKSE